MSLSTIVALSDNPSLFRGKRLVIVGDIAFDRTFLCDTALPGRHAIHAGETIFDVRQGGDDFGAIGASNNTPLFCQSLGVETLLITATGDDPEADAVQHILSAQSGAVRQIRLHGVQTVTRFRVFTSDPATNSFRLMFRVDKDPDSRTSYRLSEQIVCTDEFLSWFRQSIESADAILFNDTDKGFLSPRVIEALGEEIQIASAQRRGMNNQPIITLVDPKREWKKYAILKPDILKPNRSEACAATDFPESTTYSDAGLISLGDALFSKYGNEFRKIVVTLGKDGAAFVDCQGPRPIVAVVPAVLPPAPFGIAMHCGDMFSSAMALSLCRDRDVLAAATFANCAGALQVSKSIGHKLSGAEMCVPENVKYFLQWCQPPRHLMQNNA